MVSLSDKFNGDPYVWYFKKKLIDGLFGMGQITKKSPINSIPLYVKIWFSLSAITDPSLSKPAQGAYL